MNSSAKARLYNFMKNLNFRNFSDGRKLERPGELLTLRRKHKSGDDLLRTGKNSQSQSKKDAIGPFGYFLLGMPITTFCLGTWQVKRLKWKQALIEDLETRVSTPPVELPLDLSDLESMEYRPVTVRGRFLYDKEFKIGPRSLIVNGAGIGEHSGGIMTGKSHMGNCIVTPFQLEDRDTIILVNRGWVQSHRKHEHPKIPTARSDGVVEVTGVIRLNENRPVFMPKNSPSSGSWLYRDLNAMAEVAGTSPVYIELIADETIPNGPIAGQTRINLRNEHLSYIITWYSLSVLTGWMWYRQFIRKLPIM